MENEIIKLARKEIKFAAAAFVAVAIILKIAYYRESSFEVLRTAAALFWLFVLPGYAMTLYWQGKIGFIERIALGAVAAMALNGILSYYLGLAGLKLQNQTLILPAAVIIISFALAAKFSAQKKQQQTQG